MTRISIVPNCYGTFVFHCCTYCAGAKPDGLTVEAGRRQRIGAARASADRRLTLPLERGCGSRRVGNDFRVGRGCTGTGQREGRGCPSWDTRARSATTRHAGRDARSEPRGAELLQVQAHGSRRVFGPLLPETIGSFLALTGHGEACHDGCDGYETDTQGADKRLPRGGWGRRFGRGAACT